jgi:hypothetical protein
MSPTRSEYSKLGLDLVSLEDNLSRTPKKPSMAEEKKNDEVDGPINLLLEQALMRQRDEMRENFSHILQCLPIASGASSSSGHFGGTSPFKVQVNFDNQRLGIIDSRNQKNLILVEVIKQLGLPKTPHPQPYNIGWLRQGQDLCVSQ